MSWGISVSKQTGEADGSGERGFARAEVDNGAKPAFVLERAAKLAIAFGWPAL
jgi:hypothetical protein